MTKVEVIVGVAIVILVGGLLLSGMHRIRESATRMKCQNNLHQLGLAVHNYELTNGRLPPLADQGDEALTGQGVPSVFVHLIPYIEATNLFFRPGQSRDHYNAHSSVGITVPNKPPEPPGLMHGGMVNQVWRIFLDPADDTAHDLRDVPMTLPDGTTGYYATGSYAANGLVPWGTGTIGKSFPRGIGNTILMAERPQVCRTAAGEEVHNVWGVGFYSPQMPAFACLTPAEPPGLASTGQAAPVVPLPAEDGPVRVRIGRKDAVPQPADFPEPLQRVRDGRCDPRLPGGPHPAGMQVLMADTSVRLFDWDTSPWVFWSACVPGLPGDGP
jgi:hypothetical protein